MSVPAIARASRSRILPIALAFVLGLTVMPGFNLVQPVAAAAPAPSSQFGADGLASWTTTSKANTFAGEPSIGISHKDGVVHDALYQSGIDTYRVSWDANGVGTWTDVTDPVVGLVTATSVLTDPILFTDHETGRTFAGNLQDAVCGMFSYTDDDGENWNPMVGTCALPAYDHETIAYGPWHEPKPAQAVLSDKAAYYCAQEAEDICWTSYDGGMTFTPLSPASPLLDCESTFGHVKIGPDGTVYIPNSICFDAGGNIRSGFMFSEDNGLSWDYATVQSSASGAPFDPSLDVTPSGWAYIGNAEGAGAGGAYIGLTKDNGATWEDVGPGTSKYYNVATEWNADHPANEDINAVEFAEVVAGDDDRAAFAFLGSSGSGDKGADCAASDHVWYLYVAMTYDAGKSWQVSKADPNPVQRGKIANGGTLAGNCRNLLDFNGIDLDAEGRVYVAYADGCLACSAPQTNEQATIARQLTGKGLYAAYDSGSGPVGGEPAISISSPSSGSSVASPVTISGSVDRDAGTGSGLSVDAGGPYSGASSAAIAIAATVTGGTAPTCAWTGAGATFGDAAQCSTTVTYASASGSPFTVTVMASDGSDSASDTATVTVGGAGTLLGTDPSGDTAATSADVCPAQTPPCNVANVAAARDGLDLTSAYVKSDGSDVVFTFGVKDANKFFVEPSGDPGAIPASPNGGHILEYRLNVGFTGPTGDTTPDGMAHDVAVVRARGSSELSATYDRKVQVEGGSLSGGPLSLGTEIGTATWDAASDTFTVTFPTSNLDYLPPLTNLEVTSMYVIEGTGSNSIVTMDELDNVATTTWTPSTNGGSGGGDPTACAAYWSTDVDSEEEHQAAEDCDSFLQDTTGTGEACGLYSQDGDASDPVSCTPAGSADLNAPIQWPPGSSSAAPRHGILWHILDLFGAAPVRAAPVLGQGSAQTLYFHQGTVPVGNLDTLYANGNGMDRTAPTASEPAAFGAQNELTNTASPHTLSEPCWIYVGDIDLSGAPMTVAWYASFAGAGTSPGTVPWQVKVYVATGAANPNPATPTASKQAAYDLSATPTLLTMTIPSVTGTGDHLYVQVTPVNAVTGLATGGVILYDSTDYPSGVQVGTSTGSSSTSSSSSSSSSTSTTGSPAVERVELYEASALLGHQDVTTSGASPTASWSVSGLDLGAGDHTLTAKWFDAAVPSSGTPLDTADVTFTVSNGADPCDADTTDPTISAATATATGTTTATVSWSTDEASDGVVHYGTTAGYGSDATASGTTSHSASLSGLAAGTTYHYQVESTDGCGNTATSDDQTFATDADETPPTTEAFVTIDSPLDGASLEDAAFTVDGTAGHKEAAVVGDSNGDGFVVIAVPDTGINPYHRDFWEDTYPRNTDSDPANDVDFRAYPGTYLDGFPAAVPSLDLTIDGGFHLGADTAKFSTVPTGSLRWIPGTKIIGAYDAGDATTANGAADTLPLFDDEGTGLFAGGHGTASSSVAAGNLFGSCKECLLVAVESFGGDEWAYSQDWIDIVTVSGGPVANIPDGSVGIFPDTGRFFAPEGQQEAVERGVSLLYAGGNGNDGNFLTPGQTYLSTGVGPGWNVRVGAVNNEPFPFQDGSYSIVQSNKPVDISSYGAGTIPAACNTDSTGDCGHSGTSSATPITAGHLGDLILHARRMLGDNGRTGAFRDTAINAGVVASGTPVAGNPYLEDGKFTRAEAWYILKQAASPLAPSPVDFNHIVTVGVGATPVDYAYAGYGVVDDDAEARAIAMLDDGTALLRDTADADTFFALDQEVRGALWGGWDDDADTLPAPALSTPISLEALGLEPLDVAGDSDLLADALASLQAPARAPAMAASGALGPPCLGTGAASVSVYLDSVAPANLLGTDALSGADGACSDDWSVDVDLTGATAGTHALVAVYDDGADGEATAQVGISLDTIGVLQDGQPVTVTLAAATDRYYRVDVPAGTDLLSVAIDGPECDPDPTVGCTFDADLFVKAGAKPTGAEVCSAPAAPLNDADCGTTVCAPAEGDSDEACDMPEPVAGIWYVMLHPYAGSGTLTLVADLDPADMDGDGVPDARDDDANGDGVPDEVGSGLPDPSTVGDGMVAFIQLPTDPSNTAPVIVGGADLTLRVKVYTGPSYALANSGAYRLVLQVDCGALQPTVTAQAPGACAGGADTTTRTKAYAFTAKTAGTAILIRAADQDALLAGLPATALHIFVEEANGGRWSNYVQPTTSVMFQDAKDGAAAADLVDGVAWTPVLLVDGTPSVPSGDGMVAFIQLPTDPSNTAPVIVGGADMTIRVKVYTGATYAAANSGAYRLVLQVDCGALQPTVTAQAPGACAGGADTTTRTKAYAFTAKTAGTAILIPAADQNELLGGLPATALHVFVETLDGARWSSYVQPTTSLMFEDARDAAPIADRVDSVAWTPVLLVDGTPSVPSGDGMVAFIQLPTDPSNTAPVVGGGSAMTVRVKVFTGANYAAANSGDYRLVLQVDCGALQPTVAMAVPGLCAGGGDTTTRTVAYAFKAKAAGAAIVVPAADQEMLLGGLPATALHIFVETADGAHWSNYLQPTTSLMFEDAKDGAAVADHVDSEAWTPVILVDLADPTSSSPAEPAADGAEAMDWTDTVLEGLGLGWLFDLL